MLPQLTLTYPSGVPILWDQTKKKRGTCTRDTFILKYSRCWEMQEVHFPLKEGNSTNDWNARWCYWLLNTNLSCEHWNKPSHVKNYVAMLLGQKCNGISCIGYFCHTHVIKKNIITIHFHWLLTIMENCNVFFLTTQLIGMSQEILKH